MNTYNVEFELLDPLCMPEMMTAKSAGYDLKARLDKEVQIYPGEIKVIPLGFILHMPSQLEFQIRPRSGLAVKGLSINNTPGTVDSDYKQEVKVILINHGEREITIKPYDRVCQGIFNELPKIISNAKIKEEIRGGGFGSTGV